MSGKFDAVPVESDTVIIVSLEVKLDEYDLLYQKWYWENIYAESFIFSTADVAIMSDEELETFARSSPMIKLESSVTSTRGEQFTFINFNFVNSEDE